MNNSILRLIHSYFLRGFFGPFFLIIFPILLIFILGNAYYNSQGTIYDPSFTNFDIFRNIIAGVLISTVISVGMYNLPVMIIEFKTSTLIKRIGSTQISKTVFLLTILIYQMIWAVFATFWVLLWSGIFLGTKTDVGWSVAFSSKMWPSLVLILYCFVFSSVLGIMMVSISKTTQAIMGLTNTLYFPISLFSGSYIPKDQLDNSSVLNAISYFVPSKYFVDPFFAVWKSGFSGLGDLGWQGYGYPLIGLGFILLMLGISLKFFKWAK